MEGMEAVETDSTPGISIFPVPIQWKMESRKADRRWQMGGRGRAQVSVGKWGFSRSTPEQKASVHVLLLHSHP